MFSWQADKKTFLIEKGRALYRHFVAFFCGTDENVI
jgi:hypothetical protein